MSLPLKVYFSAPIRGRRGLKATQQEIDVNLKAGIFVSRQIQKLLGGMVELYSPHEHDVVIQLLLTEGILSEQQVLWADEIILRNHQLMISWQPGGLISRGMKKENSVAKEAAIPIFSFEQWTVDMVHRLILKVTSLISV